MKLVDASAVATFVGTLIRVDGKMNGEKSMAILKDYHLSGKFLNLGPKILFQRLNNPENEDKCE